MQNLKKTAAHRGRRHRLGTFAVAAGLPMLAGPALALGLGSVSGQAVIGQPLRVEIPLLGADGGVPASECFRVRAPQVTMDPAYVLKGGRIEVAGDRGQPRLVVTAPAVVEPVVEFAVHVACGTDLTKEYLLLSSLPPKAEAAPTAVVAAGTAPSAAPRGPVAAAAPGPQPAAAAQPAAGALRVDAETTFEALAQRQYPLQPKAREKYVRMMREANPGIGGAIAAGTELMVPAGLPVRRTGPYRPEAALPKPAAAAPSPALPAAAKPARGAGSKDMLKLGVAPERTNAELLEEAERLTGVLLEQARIEDEIAANLTRLEAAFKDLQQQYQAAEARLARLEAERTAEKAAAQSQLGMMELLAAVLAGGALGGAGLHVYNRRRRAADARFEAKTVAAYLDAGTPAPEAAKPKPVQASLSFIGDK